jgi:hypothetical protein
MAGLPHDVNVGFMSELKTKPTGALVSRFMAGIGHERRKAVNAMMERVAITLFRLAPEGVSFLGDYPSLTDWHVRCSEPNSAKATHHPLETKESE